MNNTGNRKARTSRRRRLAVAGLLTATVAAGMLIASAEISSAGSTSDPTSYTIEGFRETIKPWDSIHIPSMSCGTGYLENTVYSPGRIVPKGVEITSDAGSIGTTISEITSTGVTDWWNKTYHPITGTDGARGFSSATNWDAFSSHELVVKLHCTTDLTKAAQDPTYG